MTFLTKWIYADEINKKITKGTKQSLK